MEIADIFVINKSDRAGTDDTRRDLEYMLDLSGAYHPSSDDVPVWRPPVLSTVATDGRGVADLWAAILAHRSHVEAAGVLSERRRRRSEEELAHIVTEQLEQRARELRSTDAWSTLVAKVEHREVDPWAAVSEFLG
jgi:LAO/AO transport system kinase